MKLCFLDEFFLALGAGDSDLALSTGHTHRLPATGAGEIAVLAVLNTIQQHQKFPIFLIALIGLPGEATKNCPEHQHIGNSGQHQRYHGGFQKCRHDADNNTGKQNKHIEFIWMRGINEKDFHINDDGVLLGVSEVGRENYKEFHENHNKLFGESYCRTTISSKRIGQDIKIIADFAFMGELDYTDSLTIEDVLIIGEGTFAVNPNLRFLEIGSSVLCISESCFEKNDMLENVTIPNTVRYIFNTIFYDCKSILSINVSEDTSIIGWQGGKVQEVERNMVIWDNYTDTNRYIIAV